MKFNTNKLEQTRGLILQLSIAAVLLIILAVFNIEIKNFENYPRNFVEIDLETDIFLTNKNILTRPLPVTQENTVTKQAKFPGGKTALQEYFKNNINYPEEAKQNNIQGRVYVKFTVTRYGKIKNAEIIRNISPCIDAEALKLIKNMPDWIPAEYNNETTESIQVLSVIFLVNKS